MKDGVHLIKEEREEQMLKHGWLLDGDQKRNSEEIINAAIFAIQPTDENSKKTNWHELKIKIYSSKSDVERLIVAGALIAAEIDRLNYKKQKAMSPWEYDGDYF